MITFYDTKTLTLFLPYIISNVGFQKIVLDGCSRTLSIKYDVIIRKDKKVVASCEIKNVTLCCTMF